MSSLPPARRRRRLVGPAAAAAVLVLLAGCGGGDDETASDDATSSSSTPSDTPSDSPSDSPSSDDTSDGPSGAQLDWPACERVWRDGAELTGDYAGCLADDGARAVKADRLPCSSGQRLVIYGDRYYATAGGEVVRTRGPVLRDPEFRQVQAVCQG